MLLIIYMKNSSQKLKKDEVLAERALFVICTRVTLKIHSFSANQTCVIFSFTVYCLYDKPSQTCFLIGSYDLLEKRYEDDVTIKNILPFLSYEKDSM